MTIVIYEVDNWQMYLYNCPNSLASIAEWHQHAHYVNW